MTTMKAYCIEHGDVRYAPTPTSKLVAAPLDSSGWCKVCLDRYFRAAEASVAHHVRDAGKMIQDPQLTELWAPSNPVIILDLAWLDWFKLCMN